MNAATRAPVTASEQTRWDDWNDSGGPSYPHGKVVQFVFRHYAAPIRPQTRFLDLGCGGGVHTAFLARERFLAHGSDLSPNGIERTRQRLAREGLSAELQVGSVDAIDHPDASFEGLISIGVLDCAGPQRLAPALSEITRVLKSGGMALLVFASDTDFRLRTASHLQLHGFGQGEVEQAIAPLNQHLQEVFLDRYITTYQNREIEQNDHLVTLRKR